MIHIARKRFPKAVLFPTTPLQVQATPRFNIRSDLACLDDKPIGILHNARPRSYMKYKASSVLNAQGFWLGNV